MNKTNKTQLSYMDSVHRDGRIWCCIIIAILLLVPISISLIWGATPIFSTEVLIGFGGLLLMYWPVGAIEVFTYVPMLGAGGSYLAFVTGNIANLKLPCALDALDKNGVKAGTEEGDIISTIAIAVSSIVTTIIVALGVILIVPLSPILENPALNPAFDCMIPALFGGLAVVFISKNAKLSIAPIILMLALCIFVPALPNLGIGVMVIIGVLFTLLVARIMYKKNWL